VGAFAGFGLCLCGAVGWAVLAGQHPGDRYHWAAFVIAAIWVTVDGLRGPGLTQRRTVNAATGGLLVACLSVLALVAKGDLTGGSILLGSSVVANAVEHGLAAVAGSAAGMMVALWKASTPPREPRVW